MLEKNTMTIKRKITGIKLSAIFCALAASQMMPMAIAQTADDTGSKAESGKMEKIIVTARRRDENLQNVPIAITAFGEQAMKDKGIEGAWDLYKSAPGLQVSSGNSRSTVDFAMRGQSVSFGTSISPVNVYFAGAPVSTGQSASAFFDLENVQVLAGPQGTLFGKNSTGGAVLFAPKKPSEYFEGYAKVGVGSDNYQHFEGAVNIPISESLALRVAGNMVSHDGYTYDESFGIDLDDQNNKSFRANLLYKINDNASNYTIFSYDEVDINGVANIMRSVDSPDPAVQQAALDQQARGIRRVALNMGPGFDAPYEKNKSFNITNITELEFDNITIKNIVSYQESEADSIADADGTPIALLGYRAAGHAAFGVDGFDENFPDGTKSISEEIQVLGTALDGNLDWIVGGFYSKSESEGESHFYAEPFLPDGYGSTISDSNSHAFFAQGTYKVSEKLSVTAGYRYTWDESEVLTSSILM